MLVGIISIIIGVLLLVLGMSLLLIMHRFPACICWGRQIIRLFAEIAKLIQ